MNDTNSRLAVMTIASANYLPYAKTLMQSIRDTNPGYRRYLVLVDKKSSEEIACGDLFEIIYADEIGIKSFEDMTIRYDVMELNTAVKPFAADWLLENTDVSAVVYLDPDICVYRRLYELEEVLDNGASVVVTPHLTEPVEDGKTPNDHHMLQAGVFNLGFIAVTRKNEARNFVRWWARRLKEGCHADFANNLFTDQRWIDLAPCFLADLSVLRSPAYNVAYWNLIQRPVSRKRGVLHFGGEHLAFFHFSGLQFDKPTVVSKHQNRLAWKNIKPLQNLFKTYREQLAANGWGGMRLSPYAYDQTGGLRIAPVVRRLYRELYPKSLSGVRIDRAFILSMCNGAADLKWNAGSRVTRLMHKIYRERLDLQATFNMPEGIEAYVDWFEASAEREYGLDACFARPSSTDQNTAMQAQLPTFASRPRPNQGKHWLYRGWRKARKWLLERI